MAKAMPAQMLSQQQQQQRRRAWAVLWLTLLCTVVCTFVAVETWKVMVSGGFDADGTEATQADALLRRDLTSGPPDLTFLIGSKDTSVDATSVRVTAAGLTQRLRGQPGVASVHSYGEPRDPAQHSPSARYTVITALLAGDENQRVATARRVVPLVTGDSPGVHVGATGPAWTSAQATDGSARDLLKAELLSAPLVLLALVGVFRSVIAALVPLAVAAVAVAVTLALLRPLAALVPLSVFSTNLTAALGFGLTVDYCLFLVTRYRTERTTGSDPRHAVRTTLQTAGRAAAFSSVVIASVMAALLFLPLPFLRSMAYAGILVALCAAAASLVVVPRLLLLLDHRLVRPAHTGSGPPRDPLRAGRFWPATARAVTRRPAVWGAGALLVLTGLLVPALHLQPGPVDERILPSSTEAHAVADALREALPDTQGSTLTIALPMSSYAHHANGWERYARSWSRAQPDGAITTPRARYRAGRTVGPGDPTMQRSSGAWFNAVVPHPPESSAAADAVQQARELDAPGGHMVGGNAAHFDDTQDALRRTLPAAALVVTAGTVFLLFCFTGSVFLPLKAVVVAALSMSACFGAVTWVFQDGRLGTALGAFTVTGTVNVSILILLFCVAFGLSMDYEAFLLSCIQEEYRACGDNRLAVETGIAHTGRLVTVAALAVATAMAGLATSGITLLKVLGFGLTVGVVIDATLVRTILVPAAMCLAGRANWWPRGRSVPSPSTLPPDAEVKKQAGDMPVPSLPR
ncbi:MMPL family transporter [Streptomyces sp. NPDC127068]|uniref:MMPL family transporter n=1 Tax=Streptomyces sp. NPDC127068 TaxID=3347127 RepID=UPI00364D2349